MGGVCGASEASRARVVVQESRRSRSPSIRHGTRMRAGEHFVQERTEREDVAARVRLLAVQLLGRHVLQRPDASLSWVTPERA